MTCFGSLSDGESNSGARGVGGTLCQAACGTATSRYVMSSRIECEPGSDRGGLCDMHERGEAISPDPVIRVAVVRKVFGPVPVLDGVSLDVRGGEAVALLGPNGAGKTTLLRILATLLRPTAGEVSVLGSALPPDAWRVRGRIGYLAHEPLLYRDLTGAENLRFQARLHGLPGDGAERIGWLLDALRMSRRADEQVRNLSAGMVQRRAVCRALLHEPELLLLDEPTSHLDPEAAGIV